MSKRPITHGLLRFQADRCETAKNPRCTCRCGGALHGMYHTEEWVTEEVERDKLNFPRMPVQIDWVDEVATEAFV